MKIYAIWSGCAFDTEPFFYVEAKDFDDLMKILEQREINRQPYTKFPGWCPEEISKKDMYKILKNLKEKPDKRKYSVTFTKKEIAEFEKEEKMEKEAEKVKEKKVSKYNFEQYTDEQLANMSLMGRMSFWDDDEKDDFYRELENYMVERMRRTDNE